MQRSPCISPMLSVRVVFFGPCLWNPSGWEQPGRRASPPALPANRYRCPELRRSLSFGEICPGLLAKPTLLRTSTVWLLLLLLLQLRTVTAFLTGSAVLSLLLPPLFLFIAVDVTTAVTLFSCWCCYEKTFLFCLFFVFVSLVGSARLSAR